MSDAATGAPALPAPAPEVTLETQPFWDATRQGRLVLPQCDACGTVIWYPRRFCPSCGGHAVSWVDAAGTGSIYSFTIVRKGDGQYREAGPFVFAYVELDEGPRVMTNIVECDPEALAIGMRVEVVFHTTAEGTALARFRPAAGGLTS